MLADILRRALRLWALLPGLGLFAGHLAAQAREVVSKQIGIGRNEASLRLEFQSGAPLDVRLEDGTLHINGEALGSYSPELDAAWRALLSDVVTLEDGPLSLALRDWAPPAELRGESAELASRLDAALESTLGAQSAEVPADLPGQERRALSALLSRPERLSALAAAAEGLRSDENVRLYVEETVEVGADEEVDGTVVVVDGDLTVRGRVDGDVVLVDGRLRLPEGGRITGDVRMVDGRLDREGGEIAGDVIDVDEARGERVDPSELREEIMSELRSEMDAEAAEQPSFADRLFSPFRHVARGIAGVLSTMLTIMVLSAIGGVVMHFGPNHLDVVAETARRAPARAAAVGLAGTFLALPVWLLGALALIVSIIGIPVALLWLPLFPVALLFAAVLGYYAVARNVGGWVARREYPYMTWVRGSNPYTIIAGGVLILFAAFVVSSALAIAGPWLGFLRVLFMVAGILVTVAAVLIGLGAVLITRGGRRPEYYPGTDFFGTGGDDDFGSPSAEAEVL